ncbi:MAG: hypothetical protein H6Q42_2102, partial [Deltaproteobacteria bacterium]|nr:hypothetical protein [Deltaproteobacteria bacterium]
MGDDPKMKVTALIVSIGLMFGT